jgi:lipopolysaccharide biosynthesis glycosyltransferase
MLLHLIKSCELSFYPDMSLTNVIPIVIVTDEHYIIMLAALLKSIETNHRTNEKITAYIIGDGIKLNSQRKIQESVNPQMFNITWLKMAAVIPSDVKLPLDHTSYPVTIYLRLFIHKVVPKHTQKALFLDVDMILLDDISKLYHQDLGENVIGAVQDSRLLTFDNPWGGVTNYKDLGFAPDTKYFNSGMILFDIKKWETQNLAQRIIDNINQNINYANYPDQYGFNITLANQWQQINPLWNYFASGTLNNPYAVHFISRKPFYSSYDYNPLYKELFYRYLEQTCWCAAKPTGELNRYFKKLTNVYQKVKKKFVPYFLPNNRPLPKI